MELVLSNQFSSFGVIRIRAEKNKAYRGLGCKLLENGSI